MKCREDCKEGCKRLFQMPMHSEFVCVMNKEARSLSVVQGSPQRIEECDQPKEIVLTDEQRSIRALSVKIHDFDSFIQDMVELKKEMEFDLQNICKHDGGTEHDMGPGDNYSYKVCNLCGKEI